MCSFSGQAGAAFRHRWMLFSRDRTVRPDALFVSIGSTWGNVYRMKKNSLLTTNRYLKNWTLRDKLMRKSALSSCAIEGMGKSGEQALADPETVTPPQPGGACARPRP